MLTELFPGGNHFGLRVNDKIYGFTGLLRCRQKSKSWWGWGRGYALQYRHGGWGFAFPNQRSQGFDFARNIHAYRFRNPLVRHGRFRQGFGLARNIYETLPPYPKPP